MKKRIAELDGLRGFSAILVLLAHYIGETPHGLRFLTLGWVGVDIFFVLSGFLIGGIILDHSAETGFFRWFYFRRITRIQPVYYAIFILTLGAVAVTRGHAWSDEPWSASVYATFTTNIAMAWHNTAGSVWLRPAWTLSVEEQFYIVLPLMIVLLPRKLLVPCLVSLWCIALPLRIALAPAHPFAALTLLPCRMDLLLAGVLLAICYRRYDLTRYLFWLRLAPLICLCLMLGIRLELGERVFLLASNTFASVGIATFILAILLGAPEAARYRGPVLRWFGQISYCLYLVHQPVAGLLHGLLRNQRPDINSPAAIAVTVLAAAVSVALAALSWYFLERPILAWAARQTQQFRSQRPRALTA